MGKPTRVEAENILHANRKSLRWLAKEIGAHHTNLIAWLEGDHHPRKPDTWERINAILEDLATAKATEPLYPVGTPEASIPLWPYHAAGGWMKPAESIEWFDLPNFLNKKDRVVTQIEGSSMEPFIVEGDYLLFQLDSTPRYGRVCVARNDDGDATIKVLRRGQDGLPLLDPINRAHQPPSLDGGLVYIGYLVAILRDFVAGRGSIIWDDGGLTP